VSAYHLTLKVPEIGSKGAGNGLKLNASKQERLGDGHVTVSAKLTGPRVMTFESCSRVHPLPHYTDAGAGLPTGSHHYKLKENKMKKIVQEVSGEGLESLLGERITVWCECYIYAGVLAGVNEHDILLDDASIVYETGKLDESGFRDAQKLPCQWYVRTAKIESYGRMS
jgi:hypothetical protein